MPPFNKVLSLAALPLLVASLAAADDPKPATREEVEQLRAELAELKKSGLSSPAGVEAHSPDSGLASRGGLYDKPFLRSNGPRTYVGGYFDAEFRDVVSRNHDFRLHRLVPFFVADLHERVKFASEVEIEDGSNVEVEFAFLDVILTEQVNLRGGVILDPLGRFNLYHDSPLYDLTDRPLVSTFVIPTTLREPGLGLFGTLTPGDAPVEIKYEAYITSGFKGLSSDPAEDPAISREDGLREARAHEPALGTRRFGDNNNSFAGVGRVSLSPRLGSEVGVSAHHGAYDERGRDDLTIVALDGLFTIPQFEVGDVPVGPIELTGEGAYASLERNGFARSRGVPDDFWGYYAQVGYHFLPEYFLPKGTRLTTAIFPDSLFTFVVQWNQVNLDGDRRYRTVLGLNFRPVESTVFKIDYQFNDGRGKSDRENDLDAFLFSMASYF